MRGFILIAALIVAIAVLLLFVLRACNWKESLSFEKDCGFVYIASPDRNVYFGVSYSPQGIEISYP